MVQASYKPNFLNEKYLSLDESVDYDNVENRNAQQKKEVLLFIRLVGEGGVNKKSKILRRRSNNEWRLVVSEHPN